MATNPTDTDLISWWTLDEESGERADSHGTSDLTDNNTVTFDDGKQGNAAEFVRANNECLSVADNASLSFGDEDFYMCGWVYIDAQIGTQDLISKWKHGTNDREYRVYYYHTNVEFRFQISANGIATTTLETSVNPVVDTWYFLQAWHSTADNKIYMSVNDANEVNIAHAGGSNDNVSSFSLGGNKDGNTYMHSGRLDEVAIYGRVLTGDEQEWMYNAGSGRTFSDLAGPAPTGYQFPTIIL